MIRSLALVLVLLGPASVASAQALPVQIRLDTGTFLYDGERSLAEVYLSIGASSLQFTRTDSGMYEAEVPISLTVTSVGSLTEEPSFNQTRTIRIAVSDTAALTDGQVVTDQVRMALAPGAYLVAARVEGGGVADGFQTIEARTELSVPAYGAASGTAISSVQLASRILPATDPGAEGVKSGLAITPNPDAIFGGALDKLHYYTEVYGTPSGGDSYTLTAYLTRADGSTALPGTQQRATRPSTPVDVVAGQVDLKDLPTGVYLMRVAVLGSGDVVVSEQSKRFFVINSDVPAEASGPDLNADELFYAAMGEEELAQQIDHLRVITRGREQRALSGLQTDGDRRGFLARYWRARDETAGTPRGTARREFYSRLAQVNARYTRGSIPGYKTDQGRVVLLYGPPTGIEERPSASRDSGKFELWEYDSIPGEGPSLFVFAERFGRPQLELVHSTVTGEVSLPDWDRQIRNSY